MKEQIQQILNSYINKERNPRSIGNIRKVIQNECGVEIIEKIKILPGDKFVQQVFAYLHDITTVPKCSICDKDARFLHYTSGYDTVCSKKCKLIETYGVDNPMKAQVVKDKVRSTNIKKFGGPAPMSSKQVRDKAFSTYKERTGYEHPSQHPDFMKSYKDKTGYDSPLHNPDVRQKSLESFKERTGYDHMMKDPEVINKVQISRKKKIDEIRQNTGKGQRLNFIQRMRDLYKSEYEFLFSNDEYSGTHDVDYQKYERYSFRCLTCDNTFKDFFNGRIACPKCYPKTISKPQQELSEFVESLGFEVSRNDRTIISPKELDVVIKEKNIAFEFNGLYWHIESNGKYKKYHLEKTEACQEAGIRLIHIFEDEWYYQRSLVENRIRIILGQGNKIFARKCNVCFPSKQQKKEFLNQHHIQGNCNSQYEIGLEYDGALVALMTFGRPRYSDKVELELLRYVSSAQIIGGASKLLSNFLREHSFKSVLSYADRRWSTGDLYEKLGFKLDHISSPNYWYIINGAREPRTKFQKHILLEKLEKFDPEKTEYQNMLDNGFDRIWDCGNLVYILNTEEYK